MMSTAPVVTQVRPGIFVPAIYLTTFLLLAPLTIVVSFISLLSLGQPTTPVTQPAISDHLDIPRFGARVYAALPQEQPLISSSATAADARTEIIRQYLDRYNSPLVPYAGLFIRVADQYNLDWRLLVAIAQQESNLCKKAPDDSFNCWGWGIHSKGTLSFSDYPTAIQTVAQGLREDYIDKGYVTPEEIMAKYTPQSNGSWAAGVTQFLAEME